MIPHHSLSVSTIWSVTSFFFNKFQEPYYQPSLNQSLPAGMCRRMKDLTARHRCVLGRYALTRSIVTGPHPQAWSMRSSIDTELCKTTPRSQGMPSPHRPIVCRPAPQPPGNPLAESPELSSAAYGSITDGDSSFFVKLGNTPRHPCRAHLLSQISRNLANGNMVPMPAVAVIPVSSNTSRMIRIARS